MIALNVVATVAVSIMGFGALLVAVDEDSLALFVTAIVLTSVVICAIWIN